MNHYGFLAKTKGILIPILLVGVIGLIGCQKEDTPAPEGSALVSIYQGVPNANGLDITLNISGTINRNPFEYEDYTGYLNFYPGFRDLKVNERAIFSRILVDTTLYFTSYRYYTVFLAGSYPNTEALVFEDDAFIPRPGNAKIRVIHLSPDTQPLTVKIDGDRLASGLNFKEGTSFQEIRAGTLDFQIVSAANENSLVLFIPDVEIYAGAYITLAINGYSNPPGENPHNLGVDFVRQ